MSGTPPDGRPDAPDDLAEVRTPLSRLGRSVRRGLAAVVAAAMLLPAGAWLVSELRYRASGSAVVESLEGTLAGEDLAATVLLVRAVGCRDGRHGTGSAFVLATDDGPVLVTNRHVVEDARSVGVRPLGGAAQLRVTGVRLSDRADVAVLDVDEPARLPPALATQPQPAVGGQPVRLVGFPAAMPFTTEGTVQHADAGQLLLDLEVARGASGSPVVDEQGLVVGQVFGITPDGDGVATPTAALLAAVATTRPAPAC